MKKDSIDNLFNELEGQFDIHEPKNGHDTRFLNRLNAQQSKARRNLKNTWKSVMAIAASLVICIAVFTSLNSDPELMDLASVSPELSETQDFFSVTIESELKKLDQERSPETEKIIDDALKQIKILEESYEALKIDLTNSSSDNRVIYAMISNFQSRIDVLNNVLEQIENYKQLKLNINETNYTL